jgi:dTDP-4-dehydrorhamnose 3,5-epimerase
MNPFGITQTPLKRVLTAGGDVMHGIKNKDAGFNGFGEAYFSWIDPGAVKAWKLHERMTLNLIVPVGAVKFVFYIPNHGFRTDEIGIRNYARLTVPPKVWFGFQGLTDSPSLVLNIADIPHDPEEAKRQSVEDIPYVWGSL